MSLTLALFYRMKPVIAIIGGTGLDDPTIMSNRTELKIGETPWGHVSTIFYGSVNGEYVYVLSRHGKNHDITPSQGTLPQYTTSTV